MTRTPAGRFEATPGRADATVSVAGVGGALVDAGTAGGPGPTAGTASSPAPSPADRPRAADPAPWSAATPAAPAAPAAHPGDAANADRAALTALPWRRVLLVTTLISVLVSAASYLPTKWTGGGLFAGGGEWHHIFDVGSEQSVPTAWSTMLMAGAAVLCGLCAWLSWRQHVPGWPWTLLAVGLGAFAIDEAAMIHERLPLIVERLGLEPSLGYAWLLIGIPLALVVIGVVVVCAMLLPRTARWLLVTGILVFFLGAIVVEGVTGEIQSGSPDTYAVWFSELIHAEELLELIGIGIAACAPLSALRVSPRDTSAATDLHLAVATR